VLVEQALTRAANVVAIKAEATPFGTTLEGCFAFRSDR